eukprot:m.107557 g.107557  ORF g.107557 m.107557 type:complete len:357 (-) comp13934_c0_seq2:132-1202(-)
MESNIEETGASSATNDDSSKLEYPKHLNIYVSEDGDDANAANLGTRKRAKVLKPWQDENSSTSKLPEFDDPKELLSEKITQSQAGGSTQQHIDITLTNINKYLTCRLCTGYFIGATSLTECLHTFCKSCIMKHFQWSTKCPICGTFLGHDPYKCLRRDNTIQAIVFKIVPGLAQEEARRQTEYYKDNPQHLEKDMKKKKDPSMSPGKQNEQLKLGTKEPQKQTHSAVSQSQEKQVNDVVLFQLKRVDKEEADHTDGVKWESLEKPFVKVSGRATVSHLKQFLAKKLQLENPDDVLIFYKYDMFATCSYLPQVDVLCCKRILGSEYTMEYVAKFHGKMSTSEELLIEYRPKIQIERI